jgi:hypothetical protein
MPRKPLSKKNASPPIPHVTLNPLELIYNTPSNTQEKHLKQHQLSTEKSTFKRNLIALTQMEEARSNTNYPEAIKLLCLLLMINDTIQHAQEHPKALVSKYQQLSLLLRQLPKNAKSPHTLGIA